MKLKRFSLISEIVSSTAVVVTLVILTLELSGNTEATLALNRQSIAARAENLLMRESQADIATVIVKADEGVPLDPVETRMLFGFTAARLRNAEEAYLQYRDGRVSKEYWETRGKAVVRSLATPANRQFWMSWRHDVFTTDFSDWLDQALMDEYGQ